jgi:hypothetical protein
VTAKPPPSTTLPFAGSGPSIENWSIGVTPTKFAFELHRAVQEVVAIADTRLRLDVEVAEIDVLAHIDAEKGSRRIGVVRLDVKIEAVAAGDVLAAIAFGVTVLAHGQAVEADLRRDDGAAEIEDRARSSGRRQASRPACRRPPCESTPPTSMKRSLAR